MIYLDNAATSLIKPKLVAKNVFDVINDQAYGNPTRGSHEVSVNAFRKVYECRQEIQKLFNLSDASLLSFTNNATEALNFAIKGLLKSGDHVISTVLDHNSVLRPIYQLEKDGVAHDFVGLNDNESLDYSQFEKLLKPNTRMIVCTHASNVTGELLDIDWISKFCQQHGLLFVLDASQTAGVIPIDIQLQNIDVLCFTGHKSLFGPQGTGGICFKKKQKITPLISGGSGIDSFNHDMPATFPERLEPGTMNVPGITGLSAGVGYVLKQDPQILGARALSMADTFIKNVRPLPNVILYGNRDVAHTATVGLNIGNLNSSDVSDMLATRYNIATRPGAHCAPLVHESLGTKKQGIVRFSFSSFNTDEDTKAAIRAVKLIEHEYEVEG